MLVLESKLAKKYARAFLNVYPQECTPQLLQKVEAFIAFLTATPLYLTMLSLPSIELSQKQSVVAQTVATFHLQPCTQSLLFLLLQQKRIELLPKILQKILFLAKQERDEESFTITSSHPLTGEEKNTVINFIKKHILKKIITTFTTDTSLISGIQIKSDTLLWERSIAKQLRNIKQMVLRQEEL